MENTDPKPSGRRGCFFYGCLIGSIVLLLMVIGGLFGLRYAKQMFNEFTDTAPAALPVSSLSAQQAQKVQDRVDLFRDNVRMGRPAKPLELSAEEINALIQTDPHLQPLKGKLHAVIDGSKMKAQVSVPMNDVGLNMFRGRYLNGEAELDLVFSNGILRVIPTHVTVKGKEIPQVYSETIRKQNLAKTLNENASTATALEKLQEIRVEDGKLVVVPKTPGT